LPPGKEYSKGDEATPPADDANLEHTFIMNDYDDVAIIDGIYITQCATEGTAQEYSLFLFKNTNNNSTDSITPVWYGKTNLAPTISTIYLQIFNRTSGLWETIDSDNTTTADTYFYLQGFISANLSDYYSGSNVVSCRIYQEAKQ
jgi:hypothetical protein